MSLWTKKYTIPMVLDSFSNARSIAFQGKIWTICDVDNHNYVSYQTQVFVFDPESEMFTEMNCVYHDVWPLDLYFLAATDTDLYMWRAEDGDEDTDHYLYKLNRATLEWKRVLTIRRSGNWISVVIIDQIMYVLEHDAQNDVVFLISIDLQRGNFLGIKPLPSLKRTHSEFLTTHNNTLYLISVINGTRKVMEIRDGVLIEIAREELKEYMDHVVCEDSNDCVGYSCGNAFKTRMFDFESLKWRSEVTHPHWRRENTTHLKCVVKLNRSLYTLLWIQTAQGRRLGSVRSRRFELHVLDLHPKLTSICLADLTKRLSKDKYAQKLDGVKQRLPIQMRCKLEELLKWRQDVDRACNG